MLVDNLLPELKLKQSNILTMGDFNFDLITLGVIKMLISCIVLINKRL
jgi:hypothetical protein